MSSGGLLTRIVAEAIKAQALRDGDSLPAIFASHRSYR
jgi:hypothetical protein